MSRTIAVSGGAGGIGAALCNRLRKDGDHVISIDLRDADMVADLSTAEGCAQAVAGDLDDVIHASDDPEVAILIFACAVAGFRQRKGEIYDQPLIQSFTGIGGRAS